jgi:hypothetical protein
MKNHFPFFGIKATERRLLFKQFLAGYPQISKAEMLLFVRQCQQSKPNDQPPFQLAHFPHLLSRTSTFFPLSTKLSNTRLL